MAIASLQDLKQYLKVTTTDIALENQLKLLLDAADSTVKSYCDREFESASRTWYPPLRDLGRSTLVLPERPVTSVTSVSLDADGYYGQASGAFPSSSDLTAGDDYAIKADNDDGTTSDSGILVKLPGISSALRDPQLVMTVWPQWDGGVKVVYTGGYSATTMPSQLKLAVVMLAAKMWNSVRYHEQGSPIESLTTQDFSYQAARNELAHLSSVRRMLSAFKTPSI